jgi:hypothetical protein
MNLIKNKDYILLTHNKKDVLKIDLKINTLFVYENNGLFNFVKAPMLNEFLYLGQSKENK